MKKNFVSTKDESVRMFNNPILDAVSRVHYTTPLIIFVPVVLFNLYKAVFTYQLSMLSVIALYFSGLFVWSFAEYFLHRFLFHFEPPTEFGKRLHFVTHGVHHDYPNDSKRLVMPPALSIPLASAFYFFYVFVFGGYNLAAPFFAGFITGYLIYDMMHYALHHASVNHPIFQALKRHHMVHHFQEPDRGFGVSSKLWDIILRTTFKIDNPQQKPTQQQQQEPKEQQGEKVA